MRPATAARRLPGMARRDQHRFHGDPERFAAVAAFIGERYARGIRYVADVAGGRGMLSRILRKKLNYECEVIDPRGCTLRGVAGRTAPFDPAAADAFDLVVGLHPDEATRAVAAAAVVTPTILVPCCNFWSDEPLGARELVAAIEGYYDDCGVAWERVVLPFRGPKNVALVTTPATRRRPA